MYFEKSGGGKRRKAEYRFENLKYEVVTVVKEFMGFRDLVSLAYTCPNFYRMYKTICSKPCFWKEINTTLFDELNSKWEFSSEKSSRNFPKTVMKYYPTFVEKTILPMSFLFQVNLQKTTVIEVGYYNDPTDANHIRWRSIPIEFLVKLRKVAPNLKRVVLPYAIEFKSNQRVDLVAETRKALLGVKVEFRYRVGYLGGEERHDRNNWHPKDVGILKKDLDIFIKSGVSCNVKGRCGNPLHCLFEVPMYESLDFQNISIMPILPMNTLRVYDCFVNEDDCTCECCRRRNLCIRTMGRAKCVFCLKRMCGECVAYPTNALRCRNCGSICCAMCAGEKTTQCGDCGSVLCARCMNNMMMKCYECEERSKKAGSFLFSFPPYM